MAEAQEVRDIPNGTAAGWRPVPDPTLLTTEALQREIAALRELLETKTAGIIGAYDARLAGMDEATRIWREEIGRSLDLLRNDLERTPELNKERIDCLQEVFMQTFKTYDEKIHGIDIRFAETLNTQDEKFHGVETQFLERDTRTRVAASQTALALQAAFQAAKEAVGEQNKSFTLSIDKSEKSTSEQITQQSTLLQNTTASLNDKITGIAERMTRFEGLGLGAQQAQRAQHQSSTMLVAILSLGSVTIIGIAAVVVAIITHLH